MVCLASKEHRRESSSISATAVTIRVAISVHKEIYSLMHTSCMRRKQKHQGWRWRKDPHMSSPFHNRWKFPWKRQVDRELRAKIYKTLEQLTITRAHYLRQDQRRLRCMTSGEKKSIFQPRQHTLHHRTER